MPYLIDGHNLIAKLPDIALDDPNDEAKLVLRLRGFVAKTRKQVIVIFDNGLPGGESRLTTASVRVIFASAHQTTADRIIYERIKDIRDAINWTVVSSDNEILDFAQQHGMKSMHCAEFAERFLQPPAKPDDPGAAPHLNVPQKEIDELLMAFTENPLPASPAPPPIKRHNQPDMPEPPAEKSGAKPVMPNTPTAKSDRLHISNLDVAAWMQLFDAAPPVPEEKMPKKTQTAAIAKNTKGRNPQVTPLKKSKSSAGSKQKSNDPTEPLRDKYGGVLSDDDLNTWMQVFGEDE